MANLNDKFPSERTPLTDDWMYTVKNDGSEDGKTLISSILALLDIPDPEINNNYFIDPQFYHWNDGTSFTSDGYSADMWGFSEGGGAATVTRESFTLGQTDVAGNPKYYLQHDQTSDGTSVEILYQRQQDCTKFSGDDKTFTFRARVTSGTLDVTPAIRQNFGTGGSPSTEVETQASSDVTLTTSWQKFSSNISVPSVSGKTLGTDEGSDYLEFVLLADDAATTFTVQICNVSDNLSDTDWRSCLEELNRVEPYVEHGDYDEEIGIPNGSFTGNSHYTNVNFRRQKVTVPTMTVANNQGTSASKSVTINSAGCGRSNSVASRVNAGTYKADSRY